MINPRLAKRLSRRPGRPTLGRPTLAWLLLAAFGGLLTACETLDWLGGEGEVFFCPTLAKIGDASRQTKFKGQSQDFADVLFEAELRTAEIVSCTLDSDDRTLTAAVKLRLFAVRGPADEQREAEIRYFVAIATQSRRIIAREEFTVAIPFEGNRTRVAAAEELEPSIPLRPGQDGDEFTVFVGLVLSPNELAYNRDNKL